MKETYSNYFIKLLYDIDIDIDSEKMFEVLKEIVYEGKIEKVTNYVSEILHNSSNRMFIKFDERYIQALYFALLIGNKEFLIYNEYECLNGYIDLMILPKNEMMKNTIMIELKYIKVI